MKEFQSNKQLDSKTRKTKLRYEEGKVVLNQELGSRFDLS